MSCAKARVRSASSGRWSRAGRAATLFELGSANILQAKKLGLIEKLDWAAINPAPMFPEAKNEYGFGYQYFSTIMAGASGEGAAELHRVLRHQGVPRQAHPPDYPHYCLPFALQAAGVPIDKLFPLDVDLAFKKLNEIKKDVAVWWKAGAQPPQLMKDNEVQYAICWSGRVVGDPAFGLTFAAARPTCPTSPSSRDPSPRTRRPPTSCSTRCRWPRTSQGGAGHLLHRSQPRPGCVAAQGQALAIPTSKQNKAIQYFENAEWWAENGEAVNKKWEAFKLSL